MTLQTATKRINSALRKCELLDTDTKREKFFKLIMSDFQEFEANEGEYYTSTQNLNFAIAIWLNDGDEVIENILKED